MRQQEHSFSALGISTLACELPQPPPALCAPCLALEHLTALEEGAHPPLPTSLASGCSQA